MSVLIKGMEIPKNCGECLFKHLSPTGESLVCELDLSTVSWESRPFDCQLVEVPPHGRLIDADAYHKEIRERYQSAKEWYNEAEEDEIIGRAEATMLTLTECSLTLQHMPTIIEADREET